MKFINCDGRPTEPEELGNPTIPPSNLGCTVSINVSDSNSTVDQNLVADPNGNILEDKNIPSSAVLDVLRYIIPSSEYLHVKGKSKNTYQNPLLHWLIHHE